jgi:hypothetical protein
MTSWLSMPRTASLLVSASILYLLSGFWTVPGVMSPSTFAFLAVVFLGGAAVSLLAWRNAQATSSIAQVLHATEVAAASSSAVTRPARDSAIQ